LERLPLRAFKGNPQDRENGGFLNNLNTNLRLSPGWQAGLMLLKVPARCLADLRGVFASRIDVRKSNAELVLIKTEPASDVKVAPPSRSMPPSSALNPQELPAIESEIVQGSGKGAKVAPKQSAILDVTA
jgi:hypothetical protein